MRLIVLFMTLALLAGPVLAQDKVPEGKEWHYNLVNLRNIAEVEPNDTCPGQEISCGDIIDAYMGAGDIDYFTFYADAGAVITVGTDAGPAPDAYDTQLTLYNADCTEELAFNDDGGPGYFSLINGFVAEYSGFYVAMVNPYPYSPPYEGNYILFVTCETPQEPPVNNTCDGAIAIERCTEGTIEGDLTWATGDYSPGTYPTSCTGFDATGNDVTYSMNLMAGDKVSLIYDGDYDESIYIVTDCSDTAGSCVIGADASAIDPEAISEWVVPADGTYYLIADAYGTGNGGPFTIIYTIVCSATPAENDTWGSLKSLFR